MRHITGAANTNNVMPFTYGDIHKLKPFIDIEGVCNFYNIEYDRTIVPVKLVADGDNYIIKRNDDSIVGTLTKVDDVSYQFLIKKRLTVAFLILSFCAILRTGDHRSP